jgi:hypothetical protein
MSPISDEYGGSGGSLNAHTRLDRRERRAAALRRALTVAVRRAELAAATVTPAEVAAAEVTTGEMTAIVPAQSVASFDRARARGGRPRRQ